MNFPIGTVPPGAYPPLLKEIPDPPKTLYIRGVLPPATTRLLAVVGSRACTAYGRAACEHLVRGLASYPIAIVSGLALGMDAYAHEVALAHNLITIGVPGSGLEDTVIAPRSNALLAERILEHGGALLSELPPETRAAPWTFPRRNRIMAGMSDAVLIIEAGEKSGTLITAKLATDYSRDVLVVPNSIFAENSRGALQVLAWGATPVSQSQDILRVLGLAEHTRIATGDEILPQLSESEERVYTLLRTPCARDELIEKLDMHVAEANALLSAMELKDLIYEKLGRVFRV